MQPFRHGQLQRLEHLLEASSGALRSYTDQDLDLAVVVTAFLNDAADTYRSLGWSEGENHLLALSAQFVSARAGVNPYSLERPTSYRRQMERGVALRVLQVSAERLRDDTDRIRRALDELRQEVSPLALYALQEGLIPYPPAAEYTQDELERLWRTLLAHPPTQTAARRVAITATTPDVLLVLLQLLQQAAG